MKPFVASVVSAIAILSASSAVAADNNGVYLRLDSGASFSDKGGDDYGTSAIVGAGIGYRINEHFRTDVTLGYRGGYSASESQSISGFAASAKADISSLGGLANVYYDIGKYGVFTPYVGGGIGVSFNTVSNFKIALNGTQVATVNDNTQTGFAWQLGLGTAIDVAPNVALDVGYRYFSAGSMANGNTATLFNGTTVTGTSSKTDLTANEVQIGLRYSF